VLLGCAVCTAPVAKIGTMYTTIHPEMNPNRQLVTYDWVLCGICMEHPEAADIMDFLHGPNAGDIEW
jgi:hypothetical protein